MPEPAPILLFCYNRPEHLRQTVASLRQNPLAAQSRLYVFSDGPKNGKAAVLVAEVRAFLPTIEGFAEVILDESSENRGLAASVIRGVTQVLQKHGKAIVLEDDLEVARDYLDFMNAALDTYAPRSDVFSVGGYLPPIAIPADYPDEVVLLPRASSWGWGTWLDRWQRADWRMDYYDELVQNPEARRQFTRGGDDLWPMLQKQRRGLISSWAVRWSFAHTQHHAYCLHPIRAKVRSTGADGSGTHVRNTRRYDVELYEKPIHLNPDVQPDARLERKLRAYFSLSFYRKIVNFFKFTLPERLGNRPPDRLSP
ncbi:MAG: glycosyltransferase [Cytophagaceae bacterium]|nr:glycosyltransferase [Cytophagaceae bacterium]